MGLTRRQRAWAPEGKSSPPKQQIDNKIKNSVHVTLLTIFLTKTEQYQICAVNVDMIYDNNSN